MDKNEINKLYKRFDKARSEFDLASRALATALNTPDNVKIITKKTRSAFRKGRTAVNSADLWDERMVYDLFKMLTILDILDGTFEEPADYIDDVGIYDDEPIVSETFYVDDEPQPELVEELVEVEPEVELVEELVEPEPLVTIVEPEQEIETVSETVVVEPEPYVAPEPKYESTYATQESSYESSSSSYESSSSSYDSGGDYDSGGSFD